MTDSNDALSLLIETSTRTGQVGIGRGISVVAQKILDAGRNHAQDLAAAMAAVLAEAGTSARDLSFVAIGLGPGGYTGLRVGLMTAKAVAYASSAALVGVGSFDVIAARVPESFEAVEVIADAQRGLVYVQPFGPRHNGIRREGEKLSIVPCEEWLETRDPHTPVTGPSLRLLSQRTGIVTLPEFAAPSLESLIRCAHDRLARGETASVFGLEPLYLRRSSAEENWERNRRQST